MLWLLCCALLLMWLLWCCCCGRRTTRRQGWGKAGVKERAPLMRNRARAGACSPPAASSATNHHVAIFG